MCDGYWWLSFQNKSCFSESPLCNASLFSRCFSVCVWFAWQSCQNLHCASFSCLVPETPINATSINVTFRVWKPTFIKVGPAKKLSVGNKLMPGSENSYIRLLDRLESWYKLQKSVSQGEFSSLYMLVNSSLTIKNTHLFELKSIDRSRSVSRPDLMLSRFHASVLSVCVSV